MVRHMQTLLLVTGMLGFLSGQAARSAEPQQKVKFSLDWSLGASTAYYSLAKERGYFADEGLDVTLDSGKGGAEFIQRLLEHDALSLKRIRSSEGIDCIRLA